MLPDADIQNLVIKSIESYARVETRVGSLEQSINLLRTENEKILAKISESLERLASIQERMAINHTDHVTIHCRIDDAKAEISVVDKAMQKNCNSAGHAELLKRMEATEKHCHDETTDRIEALEKHNKIIDTKLDMIINSLRLVSFKIKGVPFWMILVAMVLVGASIDYINYKEFALRFIGWSK